MLCLSTLLTKYLEVPFCMGWHRSFTVKTLNNKTKVYFLFYNFIYKCINNFI